MKLATYTLVPALLLVAATAHATTTEDIRANLQERQAEMQENMEERRTEVQTNMEERREEVQENMEERRAALSERMQERVTNLSANMSNRFDNVIERLQNIIDRTESRLEKIEASGRDTTEAVAALARAQAALDQARNTMSDIDSQVNAVVGSTEPKTEWKNLKATYTLSKEFIKTTHFELRTVISSLKNNPVTTPVEIEDEGEDEDEQS